MNLRTLQWVGGFLVAAGIAAGCSSTSSVPTPGGSGTTGTSTTGTATTTSLSPSGTATALPIPASNGVTGTFNATLGTNFPSGVSLTVTPVSSGAPAPQDSSRKTLAASAFASWKLTFSGSTATQTLQTPPSFTFSGLSSPSNYVVEIIDATNTSAQIGLFQYSSTSGTFTACTTSVQISLGDTFYLEIVSGTSLTCNSSGGSGGNNSGNGGNNASAPAPQSTSASGATVGTGISAHSMSLSGVNVGGTNVDPSFSYTGSATIAWGSSNGHASFGLIDSTGTTSSTANVTFWGGQAPNGCTPSAQAGGTVKAVLLSAEFSGFTPSSDTFTWTNGFGGVYDATITVTGGSAPSGTYYGLVADEASCSGAAVGTITGTIGNNQSISFAPSGTLPAINTSHTYVVEIWYQ